MRQAFTADSDTKFLYAKLQQESARFHPLVRIEIGALSLK
jgi:hypothetical protein